VVRIGPHEFDDVAWDASGDGLYLWKGRPRVGDARWDYVGSPEGHGLAFDERGELVHVTLVNPRSFVERDGQVPVTHPDTGELIGNADVAEVVRRPEFGFEDVDDDAPVERSRYVGPDGWFDVDAYERGHPRPGAQATS
jgi:hypothetical protein